MQFFFTNDESLCFGELKNFQVVEEDVGIEI